MITSCMRARAIQKAFLESSSWVTLLVLVRSGKFEVGWGKDGECEPRVVGGAQAGMNVCYLF